MAALKFVPDVPFAEYQERFKDHFVMTRTDGIIEVRMHSRGETARWSFELHRALPQMFQMVGADRENEVMILTGTGRHWLRELDKESFEAQESDEQVFRETNYDMWYVDGSKLQENMLWSMDIPVITAINGPGFHQEFGLLADFTLCTDDTRFVEPHLLVGLVPGDGLFLTLQQLVGLKRANWAMYMLEGISAQQALEWGLVNEVLPRERLLPRAWEIAEKLMRLDRVVRRLTTQVARRPWRRLFTDDFQMHFAHEMFAANRVFHKGAHASSPVHDLVDKKKSPTTKKRAKAAGGK